jgi:hypothetical protein
MFEKDWLSVFPDDYIYWNIITPFYSIKRVGNVLTYQLFLSQISTQYQQYHFMIKINIS